MSGLENRYFVVRYGDTEGKHNKCEFFVLDLQHDPTARVALKAYAEATTNEELRADLNAWLNRVDGP